MENVVDLCRCVNASMPESEKMRHIMKGIDEEATFQMLLSKNPQNIGGMSGVCQSYYELREQCVYARPLPPLIPSSN